jgi:hypothetical protein
LEVLDGDVGGSVWGWNTERWTLSWATYIWWGILQYGTKKGE